MALLQSLYYVQPGLGDILTVRLGERLATALEQASRQTGLAKGEIARQALESRLKSGGRLNVIRRHFGTVQGARDLSTNKAYRRRWGKKQG